MVRREQGAYQNNGVRAMNEHETIMRMIEEQDHSVSNEREINKAVALYLGWCRIIPSEMKERFRFGGKKGGWIHPNDCRDGKPVFCQLHGTDIYSDIPNYSRSRDALKAIRPEGWWFEVWQHPDGWRAALAKGPVWFCASKQKTECLAELHVIIQAIAFERSTLETTRNKED